MSRAFSFNEKDYLVENKETIFFNNVKVNVYEFWEQQENANIYSGKITAKTYKAAIDEFCNELEEGEEDQDYEDDDECLWDRNYN